jgi:cysteinyl-tRNA synthetase
MNFTWESVQAAQSSLEKLRRYYQEWSSDTRTLEISSTSLNNYRRKFSDAINDDLGFPQALALIWELAKDSLAPAAKALLLNEWDEVLGLRLTHPTESLTATVILSPAEQALIDQRAQARAISDWEAADRLRVQLSERGILVKDTKEGQTWSRK